MFFALLATILSFVAVSALENGLARTPPMGWMSWTKFYCETDCARHPFSCINEQLYKDMADRMAEDGYLDVGYDIVHIDDCWMERTRDTADKLVANRTRFPSGIAQLADYLHDKGLKLGIYEDVGTKTCGGYPGSDGHLKTDADTFAEWKSDFLKLDGCWLNTTLMPDAYSAMSRLLNESGRPMVYSCSWPAYLDAEHQEKINYTAIGYWCNLWRNFDDINRSWASVFSIINFYVRNQAILRQAQAPGRWNDPDMIIVGNTELSVAQSKVQMSVWAIWSAPLIMSNDLRTITPEYRELLLNQRVIAVDQDPLGVFGRVVYKGSSVFVFVKEMLPVDTARRLFSYAFVVFNYGFLPVRFSSDLHSLGLTASGGYQLRDLWSGESLGIYRPVDVYNVTLEPTSVAFVKATLGGMAEGAEVMVEREVEEIVGWMKRKEEEEEEGGKRKGEEMGQRDEGEPRKKEDDEERRGRRKWWMEHREEGEERKKAEGGR